MGTALFSKGISHVIHAVVRLFLRQSCVSLSEKQLGLLVDAAWKLGDTVCVRVFGHTRILAAKERNGSHWKRTDTGLFGLQKYLAD